MSYRKVYKTASEDKEFLDCFLKHKYMSDEWEDNPDSNTLVVVCSVYLGYTIAKHGVEKSEDIISKCDIE